MGKKNILINLFFKYEYWYFDEIANEISKFLYYFYSILFYIFILYYFEIEIDVQIIAKTIFYYIFIYKLKLNIEEAKVVFFGKEIMLWLLKIII